MRRVIVAFGLSLSVVSCGPTGEQVPLITLEGQTCCILSYSVVDVVARPTDGKTSPEEMRWPAGYTAWRVGNEIEVRDPGGLVVLTTPGRYRINPTWPDWAVGEIEACPRCELGGGPL